VNESGSVGGLRKGIEKQRKEISKKVMKTISSEP